MVNSKKALANLGNLFIVPKTQVKQNVCLDGSSVELQQELHDHKILRHKPGTLMLSSLQDPDMKRKVSVEYKDGKVMLVDQTHEWFDAIQWGCSPFSNQMIVHALPIDCEDNDTQSWPKPMRLVLNVAQWRIQDLQQDTRLWMWAEDQCCDKFHCATVVEDVDNGSFKYRLDHTGPDVTHSLRIHIGYHHKVFRILPPLPVPEGRMLVVGKDGTLHNASVTATEMTYPLEVTFENGNVVNLNLTRWNHVVCKLTASEFHTARVAYCRFLVEKRRTVIDALTDVELDIEKQLLKVQVCSDEDGSGFSFVDVANAMELASAVQRIHDCTPSHTGVVPHSPVVISAEAGSGKTWATLQMRYKMAKNVVEQRTESLSVPLLIPVQKLVTLITKEEGFEDLLRRYTEELTGPDVVPAPFVVEMLQAAVKMRKVIVIVDGIDEAGEHLSPCVEEWVLRQLILGGFTVIATGRPEGIRLSQLPEYKLSVTVLKLLPLDEEQQRNLVAQQTGEKELFKCLSEVSKATKQLHTKWQELVRTSPTAATALEQRINIDFKQQPRQLITNGKGNRRCVARSSRDRPCSKYLVILDELVQTVLTQIELLRSAAAFDGSLGSAQQSICNLMADPPLQTKLTDMVGQAEIVETLCRAGVIANEKSATDHMKFTADWVKIVAARLLVLSRRQSCPVQETWRKVIADTDEVYQVIEGRGRELLQRFLQKTISPCEDATMTTTTSGLHCTEGLFKVWPLMDPVTMYTSAHGNITSKKDLAVAYTNNAVRATVTLQTLHDLDRVVDELQKSRRRKVDDGRIIVERLRVSNQLSSQRVASGQWYGCEVICNFRLCVDDVRILAEIRVCHGDMLSVIQRMSELYEEFRLRFRHLVADDSKALKYLQAFVKLHDDVRGNPVQLSLFGHVLVNYPKSAPPQSLVELYGKAMQSVLYKRLGRQCEEAKDILRKLAVYLMTKGKAKRIFLRADAQAAVGAESWDWLFLRKSLQIPLIKTLDVDHFEFQHRSFQEALFVEALIAGKVPEKDFMSSTTMTENWEMLESGSLANVWKIGGQSVGEVLKRGLGQPEGKIPVEWTSHVWSALFESRVVVHVLAYATQISINGAKIAGKSKERVPVEYPLACLSVSTC